MAQNTDFANAALKQKGKGPKECRTWFYGKDIRGIDWCAVNVSYCASMVPGVLNKIVPKTAGAGSVAREGVAKKWGKWFEGGTVPQVGDIISFCWNGYGHYPGQDKYFSDHVGIVVNVNGGELDVIEGNTGGISSEKTTCMLKTYAVNNAFINGYYRPDWASVSAAGSGGVKPEITGKGTAKIKAVQKWCRDTYGVPCKIDGLFGPQTLSVLVGSLQLCLNRQYKAKLLADGLFGALTKASVRNVSKGAKGNYVRILQGALICRDYDTGGFDGEFGSKTDAALRSFQKKSGLTADGIAGKETFAALLSGRR